MKTQITSIAICVAAMLAASCGKEKATTKEPDVDSKIVTNTESIKLPLPVVPSATGQVVFTLDTEVEPGTLTGYVVGKQSLLKVEQASTGEYFINSVPPGTFDIIVTGKSKTSSLTYLSSFFIEKEAKKDVGIRISKVEILAGIRTTKEKVKLQSLVSVSGSVGLTGQKDQSGISVYIPGTEFSAHSASDGSFSITSVPAGVHAFYFEHDGFYRGRLEEVTIEPGATNALAPVTLIVDTGAEGSLVLANGASTIDSRVVPLTIATSEDAIVMKVAEETTFTGKKWIPVTSSMEYTFESPGKKTLYVKFANANGLESSPFSASVEINLFPDMAKSLAVSQAIVLPPADPTFEVTSSSVPKNAVSIELALSPEFAVVTKAPLAASAKYSFPKENGSCGPHNIYMRFVDRDGFLSPAISAAVDIQCWKHISSQNRPNLIAFSINYGPAYVAMNSGVFFQEPGMSSSAVRAYFYNAVSDVWSRLADAPIALMGACAVWTGSHVLVWGGYVNADPFTLNQKVLKYDPTSDTWQQIQPLNTIAGRARCSAVWTGTKMIVWSGDQSQGSPGSRNDGGAYDPTSNTWTLLSTVNAPTARTERTPLVWMGQRMLAAGGVPSMSEPLASGGIYDPSTDSWSTIPDAPKTMSQGGAWTGTRFLAPVFAGALFNILSFNPTTATWKTLDWHYASSFRPYGRHLVAWVNNRLLMISGDSAILLDPYSYEQE